MQIGREKVRKQREDRDLQKSWLYAHRFVLPSLVLPGLPSQHWQHEQVTAPGRPQILHCNRYPGNQNKRGGNACYCKH